jgi:serine/threonine-protein kinase
VNQGGGSNPRCPSCQAEIVGTGKFCAECGASLLDPTSAPTVSSLGEITAADAVTPGAAAPGAGTAPVSGIAYTSPPTTGGTDPRSGERFLPGTVIAGRYRIIGLLGRGGMGEVYRADDLKLGQAVALKFLPRELDQDAHHVQRFLGEVRTARQVSHPNVCRVFDVGEVEGQHYLSMEYVDGEDLSSLLRRIGRLPQDKAIQIARQICAGLAAAHEQGMLHRDLKPANVLIDGRGQAKITDFGLAGLAEEFEKRDLRAGTPTYMAPEQLAGKEVTLRSDVYALGLVLYELFTGRRPFRADSPAELAQMQLESTPTTPSEFVDGLDPAVERAILRCLESDPIERPANALVVAHSLPGGDPLQAALAAGETPSPEMVAAAGPAGGLRAGVATACLAAVLIGILITAFASDRVWLANRIPMPKSYEVLKADAREIASTLGYADEPSDIAASFQLNMVAYTKMLQDPEGPSLAEAIEQPNQSLVTMLYRQDTAAIVPMQLGGKVTLFDPTPGPGDVTLNVDLNGTLNYLRAMPPRVERSEEQPPPMDWAKLFESAGLDIADFEEVPPQLQPPSFADARRAWSGTLKDRGDMPVRIEAASLRGKPVYFRKVVPSDRTIWSAEEGPNIEPPRGMVIAFLVILLAGFALFALGGIFLVVRSLRLGRGDRKGALRIAIAVFVLRMLHWTLTAHHAASLGELYLAAVAIAGALALAVLAWGAYVALEPYARRFWPEMLVSWNRLLSGRIRDPLVGRDILVGMTVSATYGAVGMLIFSWAEKISLIPMLANQGHGMAMQGGRFAIGKLFSAPLQGLLFASVVLLIFLVIRLIVRRTWIAVSVLALFWGLLTGVQWMMLTFARGASIGPLIFGFVWGVLLALVIIVLMIRFGLLALMADLLCSLLITSFAITADTSAPYFSAMLVGPLAAALVAVIAYRSATAGRTLFAEE